MMKFTSKESTQVLIHRDHKYTGRYKGMGYLDSQMSMKTKGLLTYLLAKPHNWRIYVSQLVKVLPEGKDAIYSSIRELVKYGHVTKTQLKDEKGYMKGVLYTVYEDPIQDLVLSSEAKENKGVYPQTENPKTDKPKLQIESLDYKNKNNNCCLSEKNEKVIKTTSIDNTNPLSKSPKLAQQSYKSGSDMSVEIWPSKENPERKSEFFLKHCLSKKYLVEQNIGEALTLVQKEVVKDVAATFAYGGGAEELSGWLTQTMLNPRAFSNSSDSFTHKLNAVITKLRTGAYTRPYALRYGFITANAKSASQQGQQSESLKERLRARAWENIQSNKGLDNVDTRSNENTDLLKDLNRQLAKVNVMLEKKITQLERESLNALADKLNMRKQEFALNSLKQGE